MMITPAPKPVLACRAPSMASLASCVSATLSVMHNARMLGHSVYADWRDWPAMVYDDFREGLPKNQWEWWFEQPEMTLPPVGGERWLYEGTRWRHAKIEEVPWNCNSRDAVDAARKIVGSLLRFKPDVTRRCEMLLHKYCIEPVNTAAVSIRGSDKWREWSVAGATDFFPALDQLSSDGYALWVKPEDDSAAIEIRRRYPGAIIMSEFYSSQNKDMFSDAENAMPGYSKGLDAATMALMLSRCAIFVKNASNIADIAIGLSSGRVISVEAGREPAELCP